MKNNTSLGRGSVYDESMELDLYRLGLRPGEGWQGEQEISLGSNDGDTPYTPTHITVTISISKTTTGYAVHLEGSIILKGECARCLEPAQHRLSVESWEWDKVPGADDSKYLHDGKLALGTWAREISLSDIPMRMLCNEGCPGLCGECGRNQNTNPHSHPRQRPALGAYWGMLASTYTNKARIKAPVPIVATKPARARIATLTG